MNKLNMVLKKIGTSIKTTLKTATLAVKNLFVKTKPVDKVVPDKGNDPINPNNIKKGEIGGYVIYNKTVAKITQKFIEQLKTLGINVLYFNTPRDKTKPETILSYDDWYAIFEKFRNSGIRIMLYIYETVDKKDSQGNVLRKAWTNNQIRSISNHPSFYGWIAEDEVKTFSVDSGSTWIKNFHSQKWSDGTRKWPNMSICMFPKTERLEGLGYITKPYSKYLETWASYTDIMLANMYPIRSSQLDKQHYNIESKGSDEYNPTTGEENWREYLKYHLEFTNEHPEIDHKLYMHVCKDVTNDGTGTPFIAKPVPTEIATKIQAYANLMHGSNGLMLFVLGDIGDRFSNAAFGKDFTPNTETYNLLKSVFNDTEFKNFKNMIVNFRIDSTEWYEDLLVANANNEVNKYTFMLNTSLTSVKKVRVSKDCNVMNLKDSTLTTLIEDREYDLKPGNIICFKK